MLTEKFFLPKMERYAFVWPVMVGCALAALWSAQLSLLWQTILSVVTAVLAYRQWSWWRGKSPHTVTQLCYDHQQSRWQACCGGEHFDVEILPHSFVSSWLLYLRLRDFAQRDYGVLIPADAFPKESRDHMRRLVMLLRTYPRQ